jgi:hypothetical protein
MTEDADHELYTVLAEVTRDAPTGVVLHCAEVLMDELKRRAE